MEGARLLSSKAERQTFAEVIGRDGAGLLQDIFHPEAPLLLR